MNDELTPVDIFINHIKNHKLSNIDLTGETKITMSGEGKLVTGLALSESFYSVQCEGASTGYPAYFIRLKGCNLICGGPGGSLMKEGKATWWCDTEAVWRKGEVKPDNYLVDRWTEENILDWVKSGRVHLIWTGGEPTMLKHQNSIVDFLNYFDRQHHNNMVYNEIETNGTQYIEKGLFSRLQQINCSVKLANCGMAKSKRIVPEALHRIMTHDNYWFKFVISTENDMHEIYNDFIKPFSIPHDKVIMMPGLDSRDSFHERTEFCLQMAKKYGYIGMTRLHISAWDKTTGV